VIAIIGILIALLLPAVQAARESARRTQCSNNLKQLALGCLTHQATHGFYPSGGWGHAWLGDPDQGFGRTQPGGWNYSVLPFIEQNNIHQLGAGLSGAARSDAFRQLLTTPVATFFCPSRRPVALYQQRDPTGASGIKWTYRHPDDPGYVENVSKSDYAMNAGSVNIGGSFHAGPANVAAFAGHTFPSIADCNGLHWWVSEFRPAHVRDGTSSTLLLGEKGFDPAHLNDWEAGDPQNIYIGHDPDIIRHAGPDYPLHKDEPGVSGFWEFTGPHPGGCLFAFCDGSVRTVGWTIDLDVYGYLANRKDGQAIPGEF
jgi:prepilin-type processing-associated H-X9-DG protein